MSRKEKLITAAGVFVFFVASVSLAWAWFGWKLAVVIILCHMCGAGDASLKAS